MRSTLQTDHESSRWMAQVFQSGKNGLVRFRFADQTKYAIFYCRFYFISSRRCYTVCLLRASFEYCMWNGAETYDNEQQAGRQAASEAFPHTNNNEKYLNNFNILFI